MDPSHQGPYRSASNRGDGEERHIVVDIFDQMSPENYNDDAFYRNDVFGVPARRRPEIDLNNPAQQEEDDNRVQAPPDVDAQIQHAPIHDVYTGSNSGSGNYGSSNYSSNYYGNNYGNDSSGGGYVDWASGSMDVAPDGNLAFYENTPPSRPTERVRSPNAAPGFDLNAAVREAQERDEAFYQERLENLRRGQAVEDDQFPNDMSFRDSSPAEDPSYYKLWND